MNRFRTYRVTCKRKRKCQAEYVTQEQKRNITRALRAHGMTTKTDECCNSDSSDTDSDASGESTDHLTVPISVLNKFLKSIKMEDWSEAKRLCKIILLYEPYNPQILRFIPLIQKKIIMEAQFDEMSECGSCSGEGSQPLIPCCDDDSDEETRRGQKEFNKVKEEKLKDKLVFKELGDDESWIWDA